MTDATDPHPTLARVLSFAQSLGAITAALLILAGLALPLVASEPPRRRHLFDLDETEWALIAASGLGIAAAALGLRTRFRSQAGWACIALGVLVLWIIGSSADARWTNHWFRDTRAADVVTGFAVASVGAVLAILSGWSATRDTPPGWVITGLTGVPIGLVEPDQEVTTRDRIVLLFGPTVLIVSAVLVVLVLAGPPEVYEP